LHTSTTELNHHALSAKKGHVDTLDW